MPQYDWTDERANLAKKRWNDGCSATEIAAELPGFVTRNAVIGKLSRMGCTRKGGSATSKPYRRTPNKDKAARPNRYTPFRPPVEVPFEAAAVEIRPDKPINPVTLLELVEHHCRWPFGDPGTPDFRYCGGCRIADSAYCNRHHLLAYTPPQRRTTLSQEERVRRQRMERSGSARAFG